MNDIDIDEMLAGLMYRLKPAKRKALIKKALKVVIANNKKRITAQKNTDNSEYEKRKQKTGQSLVKANVGGEIKYFTANAIKKGSRNTKLEMNGYQLYFANKQIEYIRKFKKNNKKMLTGFKKYISILELNQQMGMGGFHKKALGLAKVHQFGLTDSHNMKMPERELMGLSESDKEQVINLFIDSVFGENK